MVRNSIILLFCQTVKHKYLFYILQVTHVHREKLYETGEKISYIILLRLLRLKILKAHSFNFFSRTRSNLFPKMGSI